MGQNVYTGCCGPPSSAVRLPEQIGTASSIGPSGQAPISANLFSVKKAMNLLSGDQKGYPARPSVPGSICADEPSSGLTYSPVVLLREAT
jgi:hypothetical protein